MEEDKFGFIYPIIDQDICINCGLCQKSCSFRIDLPEHESIVTEIVQRKNKESLLKPSSG